MPDDLPQQRPQGLPRIFDESDLVVDPALENLTNGSLTPHPDLPHPDLPDSGQHDVSEIADEPE